MLKQTTWVWDIHKSKNLPPTVIETEKFQIQKPITKFLVQAYSSWMVSCWCPYLAFGIERAREAACLCPCSWEEQKCIWEGLSLSAPTLDWNPCLHPQDHSLPKWWLHITTVQFSFSTWAWKTFRPQQQRPLGVRTRSLTSLGSPSSNMETRPKVKGWSCSPDSLLF